MTTSVTLRAIRAASKAVSDAGLKEAGFKRQGNHLHRNVGDVIHAIHFQASQWGSAASGSFTVNLVVTSPFVYTTWIGRPFPLNPASTLFPVNTRIGSMLPSRKDQWWTVTDSTDLDHLSREVTAAILEFGLAFFELFPSKQAMLTRVRHGKGLPGLTKPQARLVHAILAAEMGAIEEAQELLETACNEAGVSGFRETVQLIAKRLGITLPTNKLAIPRKEK